MKRNSAIECIRVLAIITVICLHVTGGQSMHPALHVRLICHLASFSVVFFMIVAGYLWGTKVRTGNAIGRVYVDYSQRILKIFVLWSLIYVAIPNGGISEYTHYGILSPLKICYWNFLHVVKGHGPLWRGILYVSLTGTKYHLWFLMALVWASTITAAMVKLKRESWLIWVGIAFYIFEVISRILLDTSSGFTMPFNVRYGPFFSTIFFAIGWRLSARQNAFTLRPAVALLSGGFAILVVDLLVVRSPLGFAFFEPLLETTLGIGAALLAIARPSLGDGTILASLGKYVLGIYVIHPFFIDFFRLLAHYIFPDRVLDLSFTAMVFFYSTLAVVVLQKSKVLRSLSGAAGRLVR